MECEKMNLSKIHHIAIIVSDYEAAKDFYVNKLGLSVIRENYRPERKDWKLDLRVNEHTELEIFAEENPPKRVNRPEACGLRHLAFCVDSIEQTVRELTEVGIECEPIRVDDYTGIILRLQFLPTTAGLSGFICSFLSHNYSCSSSGSGDTEQ
jgi:glyoxylase I family protein